MTSENKTGLEHLKIIDGLDGPEIHTESGWYVQPLFYRRIPNKDWNRFINCTKALIRNSPEYKTFVSKCKNMGMIQCSFLHNVEDENATIEIHHAILGLHDICEIVTDHISCETGVTSMLIAHEVLKAHFNNMIAVVALSKTVHQLVHAGKVHIHIHQIYGDILSFLKTYYRGVKTEHILKLKRAIDNSKENKFHDENLLTFQNNIKEIDYQNVVLELNSIQEDLLNKT